MRRFGSASLHASKMAESESVGSSVTESDARSSATGDAVGSGDGRCASSAAAWSISRSSGVRSAGGSRNRSGAFTRSASAFTVSTSRWRSAGSRIASAPASTKLIWDTNISTRYLSTPSAPRSRAVAATRRPAAAVAADASRARAAAKDAPSSVASRAAHSAMKASRVAASANSVARTTFVKVSSASIDPVSSWLWNRSMSSRSSVVSPPRGGDDGRWRFRPEAARRRAAG
mmetsp:Transcript_4150/g.12915  ORF Transcript_4150/g.12915 Transcript_4150/m.12915 type:complete len:231 (-) Transcript_4150:242-934(-)